MLCCTHTGTLHRSVCYKLREVFGDEIFTLGGSAFELARRFLLWVYWMVVDLLCSRDLDLDPTTDRIDRNYKPGRFAGGQKHAVNVSMVKEP